MSEKTLIVRTTGADVVSSLVGGIISVRNVGTDTLSRLTELRNTFVEVSGGDVVHDFGLAHQVQTEIVGADVIWTFSLESVELLYCKLGHDAADVANLRGIVFDTFGRLNVKYDLYESGRRVGDMRRDVYDGNNDGVVDHVPWDGIVGIPIEFNPTRHTHSIVDIQEVNLSGLPDRGILVFDQSSSVFISGGSFDFTSLGDVPPSYVGHADRVPVVKSTEDGLEFKTINLSGGGGGVQVYSSSYTNRPAPSNVGDLFFPSDGMTIERDTGSAWRPWGILMPLVGISNAPGVWVNQGNATAYVQSGGLYMYDPPNGGVSYRILKKSAPSTPYTVTALLLSEHGCWTYPSIGIGWRESSSGKFVFPRLLGMGYAHHLALLQANSETVDVANYVDIALGAIPWMWLRITDNGTNRLVYYSRSGVHFHLVHSIGRTDFMTPNEVCLFVSSRNAYHGAGVVLLSWEET